MRAYIDSSHKPGALAWIIGVFSALAIAVFSYQLPENQWDMLGHLGGALHFGIDDPNELHRQTYDLAQKTLSPEDYLELTDGNIERKAWSTDPTAFLQVLPFYEPRVLVTGPAYLAHEAGFNPILYMRLQSSIAAGLGVLLFTLVMARYVSGWLVATVPLLASISGVLDVARFEGADALSFVGYAAAIYLMVRKSWWAVAVLALLPLTRSDMIIYCIPALIYVGMVFRERLLLIALAVIVCVATYWGVNQTFDNYGWVKQFYVAQIQYLSHPADMSVTLSAAQYVGAVVRGTVKLMYNYQFQFFAILSLIILSACCMRLKVRGVVAATEEYALGLCVLAMYFVAAHFMAFPSMHTRYFVGQYLHVAVIAAATVAVWARSARDVNAP